MPNQIERKRLKKKMLDRWENEGGRVAPDPVILNQSKPASQRRGKDSQPIGSNTNSRIENISSRTKRRALTQK